MSVKGATVLAKAKTQLEAALQNQEPPQKKLLSSDAQLISNILHNCISKVVLAATLPDLLRLNSLSRVVDEELSKALQRHHTSVEILETLEGLQQESGEDGEAGTRCWAQLEEDVKNSARDLLRFIRANPGAISGLKAEPGVEVVENENVLIRELEKFHRQMVERLLTSPDEEVQQALHWQVSSTTAADLEDLASKEEEVATAMKEVDEKICKKDEQIQTLQSELQLVKTQEASMLLLLDKLCNPHIKASKVKRVGIQQEIDQLKIQLNSLMLENKQAETLLQEKNEKVETEIEELLRTFDGKMEEIQANLDINEMDYEREEEELRMLEKHFSVLEAEYNHIQERRRLAEERRKEGLRELELKTKAAVLVQAWWRGYSTRKALKNKGKNRKAKKGKGKKTK
ncbi:dynein regulatory complex protein 10 [Pagrus major]|uniref:dynein regulatory complex protein 10 n=1 Tax=Pagrus major TaxID=143350 RepID=UPI003CC8C70E